MILAVDVGNTQTVIGLVRDGELGGHWRVSTDASLTSDELRVKIGGLLSLVDLGWADIERLIISSVVPTLTLAWEELAQRSTGRDPLVVGPGLKTGLVLRPVG